MNFQMTRGDTANFEINVTDVNGPVDLSGYTLKFSASKTYEEADMITKTIGNGIVLADAANGKASLRLVPADTASLANRKTVLVYDLQISSGSDTYTIQAGTLTVNPEVSN